MNSRATTTTSVSRTDEGDGRFGHPWNCWEEEISEIHLPLLTAEDELEAHLKAINCGGGNDVTDAFGFDISDAFPGVTIDIQSLFGASEEINLPELFDCIDVESETSSPLLHSLEKNAKTVSLAEPSHELLTDCGSDFMLDTVIQSLWNKWNPDVEELVCMTAVGDEEQFESSPVESDSSEEFSSSHSVSSKCRSAYFESSAEENGVDDEDWMTTRKRKRRGKKGSAGEPRRKSTKMDPKSRKKEQNRNAATRYREKKKLMDQEMEGAIELLEIRNRELKKEIQDKEQEVCVIRQLLVDILRPSS